MTRQMDIGLLRSLLRYDADTGLLFWKPRSPELFINDSKHRRWSNRCADKPALAGKNFHGYRQGKILGQLFQAHRVIWALHYGEWPDEAIAARKAAEIKLGYHPNHGKAS